MEVDKVADMVDYMAANNYCPTWSWIWWPTWWLTTTKKLADIYLDIVADMVANDKTNQ